MHFFNVIIFISSSYSQESIKNIPCTTLQCSGWNMNRSRTYLYVYNWHLLYFMMINWQEQMFLSSDTSWEALVGSLGFPGGLVVENPPASTGTAGDLGSIPGSGRSPRVGSGNPLQYSYWDNSRVRGAWRAVVHGVTEWGTTEHICIV